jgi:cyclohexa-1,5-dienecarbonyl-CoA hydratase
VRYSFRVTQSSFQRISLRYDGPVAHCTLDHPPLNVIDIPMMDELAAAFAEIEANPVISIVVFHGSERAFSVGVDVAAHTPEHIQEMLTKFHTVIKKLVTWQKISIAEVRGHCLGGGAELAMVCDFVITAEDAIWGFPEIKLACYPPVAVTALASLVGQKRAADMILTGREFPGLEAYYRGLATSAVPAAELSIKLDELLERLKSLSPAALALTRKAIYAWDSMHFDKGLARAEKIYLEELMRAADAHEGVRAFLEKRPPRWEGK